MPRERNYRSFVRRQHCRRSWCDIVDGEMKSDEEAKKKRKIRAGRENPSHVLAILFFFKLRKDRHIKNFPLCQFSLRTQQ
jgi:hypothetical protein